MSRDPYDALGVSRTATDDEIRKAYRKIAKTSHPDLNPGDTSAEARFKEAAAAYDLLRDPETRARYDKGEIDATGAERPERRFYREYTEQPGNTYYSSRGFEDFGDANDIFAEILRQRGTRGDSRQWAGGFGGEIRQKGQDARYTLDVSFLDATRGSKQRITLPGGDALEVTIPEGAKDGQTIRLRGKGGEGIGGGARGDALITLNVRPDRIFRRDGDDIVMTLPVTPYEAVLGARIPAPTIDGMVALKVPPGSSGGKVLRLRGRGARGRNGKGDALFELRIALPDKIDETLKKDMEAWRDAHPYDPRKGVTE
ncbi:DnaJ C-terminal domain-containing protein [Tropicimonas sp.]|uniref:DnaJ C-terminal domain-containing protein n=1 Tax=Tropicimonas sp. TaxID=2067044 RepID=UPI003A87EDA7